MNVTDTTAPRVVITKAGNYYGQRGLLVHRPRQSTVAHLINLDSHGQAVVFGDDFVLEEEAPKSLLTQAVKSMAPVTAEVSSEGRKGKPRTTRALTPELLAIAVSRKNAGEGMVAIAADMNLAPNELSPALKEAGCIIKKGRGLCKQSIIFALTITRQLL